VHTGEARGRQALVVSCCASILRCCDLRLTVLRSSWRWLATSKQERVPGGGRRIAAIRWCLRHGIDHRHQPAGSHWLSTQLAHGKGAARPNSRRHRPANDTGTATNTGALRRGDRATPAHDPGPANLAYHFVDAYAVEQAESHHAQASGVTSRRPPPTCPSEPESCGTGLAHPPVRTYWREGGS
jgi:hypothetical protein